MTLSYGNGLAGRGSCLHGTPAGLHCYACSPHTSVMNPAGPTFQLGGWRCPSCQRCHSPSLLTCPYCGPGTATHEPGGDCVPVAEGGMCDHGDGEEEVCRGGRHCSC